jgi:hypothetical protein
MIRNPILTLLFIGAATMCFGFFAADSAAEPAERCNCHVSIQVIKDGARFRVADAQIIPSGIGKQRRQRYYSWRYRVVGEKGKVLFDRGMNAPGQLRGAFQDESNPRHTEHVRLVRDGPVRFVIRVPLLGASRIEFYRVRAGDLDRSGRLLYSKKKVGAVPFPEIETPLQCADHS